jgi:phosphomannomutase
MNLLLPDFRTCGSEILEQLHAFAASQPGWTIAPDNYEGVRVNLDAAHGNGWFLLRMSLHDPLMPLNIESDSVGGMKVIARELYPFLAQFDGLDTSALAECIR